MRAKQFLNEDWNKVNKKDKTDGLSQKAVDAYRRENPGSKLKTAVTTKPSKLKAGSKDANRRKSFCARMSGNKGPMKDEKGRPTPKAKALSRWNCEEDIQQFEQSIEEAKKTLKNSNPCWKGYKPVGTKKKNGKTVPNCVPKESVSEASLGTNPKRPSREGSRPERGHEPQKRYVTDRKTGKQYDPDEEFDKLKNSDEFKAQMRRMATKEESLEEYGDTAKGQKMLTKVQKRAVDRVVSKKADTDPKYAKKNSDTANRAWERMTDKDLEEGKTQKQEPPKPRNFVAKNAVQSGAGAHKDKKKADKQGDVKHKGKMMDISEMESVLERASRQLCKSSKPDKDLGASNLASCKSQGYRARDGEKSHLITAGSRKVRVTVGGKKIKGKKYGGPLPDYGTRK